VSGQANSNFGSSRITLRGLALQWDYLRHTTPSTAQHLRSGLRGSGSHCGSPLDQSGLSQAIGGRAATPISGCLGCSVGRTSAALISLAGFHYCVPRTGRGGFRSLLRSGGCQYLMKLLINGKVK
jgi:hypothetical protein